MKKLITIILIVAICCGCTMAYKRNLFVELRNEDIGEDKDIAIHPLALVEIIPYDEKLDKYVCAYEDTGCVWAFYVNKETDLIESWEFISPPEKCYTGLNWGLS